MDKGVHSKISHDVIRKSHAVPIMFYRIGDMAEDIFSNPNFLDSLLALMALIAFAAAFPFYPWIVLAVLAVVLFAFTLRHAFLGFIILMLMVFPMLAYQVTSLSYLFIFAMTLGLVFGYRHYRTLMFCTILVPLALSSLGYILAIPVFIVAILVVGYKRALVLTAVFVIGVVMISGVTGIQNSAYITYSASKAQSILAASASSVLNPALNHSVRNNGLKQASLASFGSGIGIVESNVGNLQIINYMYTVFGEMAGALAVQPLYYLGDMAGLMAIAMLIDGAAVASRSLYKGTEASLIGIGYPLLYLALAYANGSANIAVAVWPAISFVLAPAAVYVMELYGIGVVKALDVRKEDLRLKFGEAFEDLVASSPNEKFSDIGNYEATKKELRDAVISPIENKALAKAYNIKPARGILLFGPPGNGKTMLMRAIANDIHAGFFLVKSPDLISAYPGDTEKRLNAIFNIASKNAPCILFFDEIDAIARSRSKPGADETHRYVLSELLVHMDGFQKLRSVVVVGATNTPDSLDPAILRPGRFDKAIYMPVPDLNGRKEIFKIYLKRLPASRSINVEELAKMTERFSGADIKSICDNVAQEVAQEAADRHKVLEISQEDFVSYIRSSKPSASLAQLKMYEKFRIDFERRAFKQDREEAKGKVEIEDVVGLEAAKTAILDAVKGPLQHPEMLKKYNVNAVKGILLFGPPGNGKTMLMKAIRGNLKGVTMLDVSGADLAQEEEKGALAGLKEVFDRAAENAPSILFIDEIDGIAPSRKGASEEGVKLTEEFLVELDGITETPGVVLVCATNRPGELDPALLRPGRLDKIIYVQPPDESSRAGLFRKNLEKSPTESMDYNALAKESSGFTGADIANICREAKTKALDRDIASGKDEAITMDDVRAAMAAIKPSAPAGLVKSYESFLKKYGQR